MRSDVLDRLGFSHGNGRNGVTVNGSFEWEWVKTVELCNRSCIGCQYCFRVAVLPSEQWCYTNCILYKQCGTEGGVPFSTISIACTQRRKLGDALTDCVMSLAGVMEAMDFVQISGTDFVDCSKSGRSSIHQDAMAECKRLGQLCDSMAEVE